MGPPPRSFAADAHDCIMVRVLGPTEYKVVARLIRAPARGLPSDRHPDRIERATVLGAVKVGLASAERMERLVRRPTLTAPARAGFAILRVGTWRNRGVTTAGTGWPPRNAKGARPCPRASSMSASMYH